MASRDLADLTGAMEHKALFIIDYAKKQDTELLVYCTHRSLREQAYWWRWSRTTREIQQKIRLYHAAGYHVLADALDSVGPVNGSVGLHKTYACAGESWHQFGEAFDAVPLVGGKCAWTDPDRFAVYSAACKEAEVTWGGDFKSLNDSPHAQLRERHNPLTTLSPDEVEDALDSLILFSDEEY